MPLHDWTDDSGWENFHGFWTTWLAEWLRPRLPEGFRVYIGSYSRVGLAAAARPDVGVAAPTRFPPPAPAPHPGAVPEPDSEVAVATADPQRAVYVQYRGLMVAAIELVSPKNKHGPSARAESAARYAGYLWGGIHLLLVDLLPHPREFSFADAIAADLGTAGEPRIPTPFAVSYRVRDAGGGGRLGVWRRPLGVGEPLPQLPLALGPDDAVMVDLEETYMRAAASTYLA